LLRPGGCGAIGSCCRWRDPANILTMGEGGTPLLPATNLGLMLGRPHLFVRTSDRGPTGSFKDRQAARHLVHEEQGITEAVVASTGNVRFPIRLIRRWPGSKLCGILTSSVRATRCARLRCMVRRWLRSPVPTTRQSRWRPILPSVEGCSLDLGSEPGSQREYENLAFRGCGAIVGPESWEPEVGGSSSQNPRFRPPTG